MAAARPPTVVVVEERGVVVDGALNVRDLGGLRTADGRQVRSRRVLRADSLSRLEEAGVATLVDDIGVRLIIDLRVQDELGIDGRGALEAHPVRYENLPLRAYKEQKELRTTVAPDLADIDLAVIYAGYLEHSPDSLVRAVTLISEESNLPAVVHCTVGKDRTGIVVAMLLDVLGVEHEVIVADYAETAHNMEALLERLKRSELFRRIKLDQLPPHVLSAEPDTMRRFLAQLSAEHGGAERWFTDHGVSAKTLEDLRSALLSAEATRPQQP
ncbi:MAG: protein-tyrosine phosphatase [Frankiales bacterium]|jgi:protein tyrosine/serine phosphatase|nr:protein-tyrosine phosphatase [Frankiales bacterium]